MRSKRQRHASEIECAVGLPPAGRRHGERERAAGLELEFDRGARGLVLARDVDRHLELAALIDPDPDRPRCRRGRIEPVAEIVRDVADHADPLDPKRRALERRVVR